MPVNMHHLRPINFDGTQIYNSDKLELIQRMHRLRAIDLVETQTLLKQTRVDSDFIQTI